MTSTTARFLDDSSALINAIERCGIGVWRWKIGSEKLEWTRNLEVIHGLPAGTFDGTLASFNEDIHPEDVEAVWTSIRASITTGQPYEVVYRTAPRLRADPIWIRACGATVNSDGATYLTGTCQDVTREARANQELDKRVRHLGEIAEFGSFALGEDDFQKVLDRAVEVAAIVFDAPLTKILQFGDAADSLELKAGRGWKEGLVGSARVGIDAQSQAGYTLAAREPVIVRDLRSEARFSGPSLLVDHEVISGMSVTIESGDRPFGVFGVHDTRPRVFDEVDVRSLRSLANAVANAARNDEARKRQELLAQEIAHRSNNLLQVVGVIAKQTFTPEADPARARASFGERLLAISRANALIMRKGWMPTRLRTTVEEVLLPYGDRVETRGSDLLLPPQLCFDLALILHELATNSVKYGSLGSEEGGVAIVWAMREKKNGIRHFELEWRDPKTDPRGASGSGFGRRLKSSLIEAKWGGEMTVEVGEHYRFACSIPLSE